MDPLIAGLRKVRRRLSVHQWLHFSAASLLYSVSVACLWVVLTRTLALPGKPLEVGTGLVALGLLLAAGLAWVRRPTLLGAALAADARLNLKERFTSSLELEHAAGPMILELHEDARHHLRYLDPRRDFPFVASRPLRIAWIPVVLFGLAYLLMPELDLFGFEARRVAARIEVEKVQMRVQRLTETAELLKEIAEAVPHEGLLAEAPELLTGIAEELARGAITEKQALAKVMDLREALRDRYNDLERAKPAPKLAAGAMDFGAAEDLASAIQQGKFDEAAQKARELSEQLKSGQLSPEELKALADSLAKLSKLVGMQNPALAKALAQACQACTSAEGMAAALAALAEVELSLEELASILAQLDALAKACAGCGQCIGDRWGPAGIGGQWEEGDSDRFGPGMGRRGRGAGGQVGELPDVTATLNPSLLPGNLTEGDLLLSVEEQAPPDQEAQATVEFIQGAFVQAGQEAEQALEQEEIPRGSREFVRRYFGAVEGERSQESGSRE